MLKEKNILSTSMTKLTTSVQSSKQHSTDAAQTVRIINILTAFHETCHSTPQRLQLAENAEACRVFTARLSCFRAELEGFQDIEAIHQAEIENLVPPVCLANAFDLVSRL